ncbi:hypothetical protein [Edaphobacter sp. 12200R-103]|jgi:hypothetical protein|uniref:DUF6980 family protein n=1 Tax=Edaphobacter sp. 12200R-103 TaxID=2703788 RepID=UPI00138C01A8|nr:hypothetical protein [Edaphobacter sp. 12200R-103]QHS52484.1 hypothetical protein GWR55_12655 [Edaphobacter sp. 12200R-103]
MSDHCCQMMNANLAGGETAIEYIPKFREYGIAVFDGGSSYIVIAHCPWCGVLLPESLREHWFSLLEDRGLEPDDQDIPEALRSDAWWKEAI